LGVKETLLGASHPDLAPTLANLASLHAGAGRRDEAAACYRRAIAILEPLVEPDHPTLVACREDYATL
jgi:tetratricopeptide (TPR) repeat protein